MKALIALAALTFLAATPALAQTAEPAPATLTVSGSGSVTAEPDLATVSLGVVSRGGTAREALSANNSDMTAVIAAIRAAGIGDRDIGTSGFSISPVYQPGAPQPDGSTGPSTIVGYEVSNEVTVTVRDIGNSGPLLDAVISAGANRVTGIGFGVADPAALEDQAAAAAVTGARHKAEVLASAAHVRLVRILSISTDGGSQPMYAMRAMAFDAGATPIMQGTQTISASATIVWEIAAP